MRIGVLALQGDFREHIGRLRELGAQTREVRLPRELEGLDGLILPGGESTTMGKLSEHCSLTEPLRNFIRNKPVWGTCAGLILLAREAAGQKRGGQLLLGGLDITVDRNYFGRQRESFECGLEVPALETVARPEDPAGAFPAVFIRAPVVTQAGPGVETLAALPGGEVVAVRQGRRLGTAFHPELGEDLRFHRYFLSLLG